MWITETSNKEGFLWRVGRFCKYQIVGGNTNHTQVKHVEIVQLLQREE